MSIQYSVVVQGPIIAETTENGYATRDALQSIRRYFPGCEIVLSTWESSNVDGLEFDKVVFNEDPGGVALPFGTTNFKRLIFSTANGIRNCTHDHVIKTRTDVMFLNDSAVRKFESIPKEIDSVGYKLFEKKVLSTNFYVRNPVRMNLCFHCSDIFLVGQKQDLLGLFDHDVTVAEKEVIGQDSKDGEEYNYMRCAPEQYLIVKLLSKRYGVNILIGTESKYLGASAFRFSEQLLFKNFKFYHPTELGVALPQRFFKTASPETNYSKIEVKIFEILFRIPRVGSIFGSLRSYFYYRNHRLLSGRGVDLTAISTP